MLTRGAVLLLWVASALTQTAEQAKPGETDHYPALIRAEIPLYPPAAWSAHLIGEVEIEVTIDNGIVVGAKVKHGRIETQAIADKGAVNNNQAKFLPYLSLPSVANLKTWQFQPGDHANFIVKYVYRIEGEQTLLPENPKVELHLPHLVTVTARPFKPTTSGVAPGAGYTAIAHPDRH